MSDQLRNIKVEYIKGKYAYKQRINVLDSNSIKLSGSIKTLKKEVLTLYEKERENGRLDKKSRDALKGLQMNLYNPIPITSKGVTHVIVYENKPLNENNNENISK